MLSYPLPEAETLLESKLKTAQTSLGACEEDLDFLREQITVRPIGKAAISVVNNFHLIFFSKKKTDVGSCYCSGLQLGRGTKEKREIRG
jgi:hypothetical protein